MEATRHKGTRWEQIAESFLHKRGLKTVERNYHGRIGEIDLVMLDRQTLVFTEVRYRENSRHGSGADSVTPAKQRRIIAAAQRFLQHRKVHQSQACRFDVVSIGIEDGETVLNWIRNAFDAT